MQQAQMIVADATRDMLYSSLIFASRITFVHFAISDLRYAPNSCGLLVSGSAPWLRNALITILTNIGLALPGVFIGSFLIEVFFSIPGLGREILLAVNRSDYPVIQAFAVYIAVITMVVNLITDVLYKLVDPRVVLS